MNDKDSTKTFIRYGVRWKQDDKRDWLLVEQQIIRDNGKWQGKETGCELWEHWQSYISELFPGYVWHRWNLLMLKSYLEHQEVALLGPPSTGKTNFMSVMALGEWWLDPAHTTVICSTTTMDALKLRIFSEINKWFTKAKKKRRWLEGHYMASMPGIILQKAKEVHDKDEGRDMRASISGVACKTGTEDVGLAEYSGIKNARMRLFADEGPDMSRAFINGAGNLVSNNDFKMVVSGNPRDPSDALGIIAEPHPSEGGWEGLEQGDKTRTWKNRREGGISVQLVGLDSPNLEYPEGEEPYSWLIGRRYISKQRNDEGEISKVFARNVMGHMLVGGSKRRVITPGLCRIKGATELPVWKSADLIRTVWFADISYLAVGGDRSVLVELSWGPEVSGTVVMCPIAIPVIIPVKNIQTISPEDQIATFCKKYIESRGGRPTDFGFDGTGRSSFTSAACRIWSPSVVAVEFGGKPTERSLGKIANCRDKYDRFVSELWFAVREVIDAGQMRGITDPYIEEGEKREWHDKPGGKQAVVTKEVMKELLGRSPDIFDALVGAVEMARRKGFQITTTSPASKSNNRTDWLNVWKNRSRSLMSSATLTST